MMLIYLADLTHTGLLVASNVMPLAIGLVGANIMREIPGAEVVLFKYPDDLDRALSERVPDVVGFSCYSWNMNLGMEFAKRISQRYVWPWIIAGGPNYEPDKFWDEHSEYVDYFVYREGEIATVELLKFLGKKDRMTIPGVHDATVRNEPGPRIKDLDLLPSPYTIGLMDKFFDGVLIPLVHTTRGCPFSSLAGDTPVNTVYGMLPIKHIAENYDEIGVFTYDPETGEGRVVTASYIMQTGHKPLVRVLFDDGSHIDCTADHRFLQFKWGNQFVGEREFEVEAQHLEPGAHVRALNSHLAGPKGNEYFYSAWKRKGRAKTHRMIAEWMIGRKLGPKEHVHHKDRNRLNNVPENLEVHSDAKSHVAEHPEIGERMRRNNPMRDPEVAARAKASRIANGKKIPPRTEEQRQRYRESKLGRKNPNYKNGKYSIVNHRVVSVTPLPGLHDVYDLQTDTEWFYANNVLVHNCTFCQEGAAYYGKVAKRSTLSQDLEYIGPRVGTVKDLYLSDANVGMFKEEADKARAIAQVQAKYKWPEYIHCSAGKNHKERVLEFAEIIGGRMGVAASLQSTDAQVLKNIKRENISTDELMYVAKYGSKVDANTFSEIILGLPGDSLAAHIQSLRDAVNSGVSYLRMYQLIMLPETEMNTQATRDQYGIKTHWRIMPRCFGRYSFQGESFDCAEIEEICTSQDSLSFDEYLQAREWDLTIEITHNANIFRELFGLCQVSKVEWFELLSLFHERRKLYLDTLYATFKRETILPLWSSLDEAKTFAVKHLDSYLEESLGVNELFNAKAVAFFNLQEQLHDGMYAVARELMPQYGEYLEQARDFSLNRKQRLLDKFGASKSYDYDFEELIEADFSIDPSRCRRRRFFTFVHDRGQRETIDQLVHQYGTSNTGLGRILLRAHLKKLFRKLVVDGVEIDRGLETQYRRSSNLAGD